MSYSINSTLTISKNKKSKTPTSTIVGQYKLDKTIGEGTFGKVKIAINIPTKELVAIKIIEKSKIHDSQALSRIDKEINNLKRLSHPNIIQLYEILENSDNFYVVMEFANGGELFTYIVENEKISENEASYFFSQIIHSIEAMHQQKLCHRDIKPENILLTNNKIIKIIDFGLSNEYSESLSTSCGSFAYVSPEIIKGSKYDGLSADLWASGIILYAMVCGYLPFDDQNKGVVFTKILECKIDFPEDDESNISQQCKDLIIRMLALDPAKRLTLDEIKQHPFLEYGNQKYDIILNTENNFSKTDLIIDKMVNMLNYKKKEISSSIKLNKFNGLTAVFKLLKKKYIEGRFFEDILLNQNRQTQLARFNNEASKRTNKTTNPNPEQGTTISTCNLLENSAVSSDSILVDLDCVIQKSNKTDLSSLIIINNINMLSHPAKKNSMISKLILNKSRKLGECKTNNSISTDKTKSKNEENLSKKARSSIPTTDKKKTANYRYHRNRIPLNNMFFNNQMSFRRKNTTDELKIQNTDCRKNYKLDTIFIQDDAIVQNKTTYNTKRNSKETLISNTNKPKKKMNTFTLSNALNNKTNSNRRNSPIVNYIKKTPNISTVFSPFKTNYTLKEIKSGSPIQRKNLLSEIELNKMTGRLDKKKKRLSKNRLLILKKPKHESFAICTSKLPKNTIEKNLKEYCNNNKLKLIIEAGGKSDTRYVISINNSDKFVIELGPYDNLSLLRFYHLLGKEDSTMEYIKKMIANAGF